MNEFKVIIEIGCMSRNHFVWAKNQDSAKEKAIAEFKSDHSEITGLNGAKVIAVFEL